MSMERPPLPLTFKYALIVTSELKLPRQKKKKKKKVKNSSHMQPIQSECSQYHRINTCRRPRESSTVVTRGLFQLFPDGYVHICK